MEVDLRARDTVIRELESRITSSQTFNSFPISNSSHGNTTENNSPTSIEVEMMQQQLNTLQSTIGKRDEQIEQLNLQIRELKPSNSGDHEIQNKYTNMKTAFDALQNEQDDLLIMLSDQDNKLELYKNKLREMGHNILSDDESQRQFSCWYIYFVFHDHQN
jgi:chromosome segregation ATPase